MRNPALLRLAAVATLAAALATAGCPSAKRWYADTLLCGETITYQQFLDQDQYADPKPTVDDVLRSLGEPLEVIQGKGFRRKLVYHGYNVHDDLARAEFTFDKDERLMKKEMW